MEIGTFVANVITCQNAYRQLKAGNLRKDQIEINHDLLCRTHPDRHALVNTLWHKIHSPSPASQSLAYLIHEQVANFLNHREWNQQGESHRFLWRIREALQLLLEVGILNEEKMARFELNRYLAPLNVEALPPLTIQPDETSRVLQIRGSPEEVFLLGSTRPLRPGEENVVESCLDSFISTTINGERLIVLSGPCYGLPLLPHQVESARYACEEAARQLMAYPDADSLKENLPEILNSVRNAIRDKFPNLPSDPRIVFVAFRVFAVNDQTKRVLGVSSGDCATFCFTPDAQQVRVLAQPSGKWSKPSGLNTNKRGNLIDHFCPADSLVLTMNRTVVHNLDYEPKLGLLDAHYLKMVLFSELPAPHPTAFGHQLSRFLMEVMRVKHHTLHTLEKRLEREDRRLRNRLNRQIRDEGERELRFCQLRQQHLNRIGPIPEEGLGPFLIHAVNLAPPPSQRRRSVVKGKMIHKSLIDIARKGIAHF